MDLELNTLEQVTQLKNLLIAKATGGGVNVDDYVLLRRKLLGDARVKSRMPSFLRTCTSPDEFWGHIKEGRPTYQDRREYLREKFADLINFLESANTIPIQAMVNDSVRNVSSASVAENWHKAIERVQSDPAGSITAARSLIESVLKFILGEMNIAYGEGDDLPKLYKTAAKGLNLAPEQNQLDVFKRILGGCENVVTGLGELRNKAGDAHGRRADHIKPAHRHAELAVNLAGSMALFLIHTHEHSQKSL